ncbi:MAG: tetratricopeptide repeat protein [Ignavibacteriae bacterium]|nr:tetratricopeptide repeat protein [Ignavibacteriota bacterium]
MKSIAHTVTTREHIPARLRNIPTRPRPLFMVVLLAGFVFPCAAQRLDDPRVTELVKRGIEMAGHQRYSEARAIFDEVIRTAPEHPAGYLNKAILLEVMSLDFETPVPQPEFDRLLEKTESLCERILEKNERSVDGLYFMGMVHSYIAYYKFRDGENWLSGLRHGFIANGYLEDCLALHPGHLDALTSLGTYKYWKSKKMSFLTWTPFVDDESIAGIDYLRLAERAPTTGAQASNSLIWIYIEEERFTDAIRTAQTVLRKYPANRLFLWGLASAAERKGDLRLAIEAYRRILASIDKEVLERRYIEIQARAKIARHSFQIGEKDVAATECAWVLANARVNSAEFTPDGASRIKKRVADMEKLRTELKK